MPPCVALGTQTTAVGSQKNQTERKTYEQGYIYFGWFQYSYSLKKVHFCPKNSDQQSIKLPKCCCQSISGQILFKDSYTEKYKPEEGQVVIKIINLSKASIMGNHCI